MRVYGNMCVIQVAAANMPMGSLIVGVDLVPIKPIRGAKTMLGDITTQVLQPSQCVPMIQVRLYSSCLTAQKPCSETSRHRYVATITMCTHDTSAALFLSHTAQDHARRHHDTGTALFLLLGDPLLGAIF